MQEKVEAATTCQWVLSQIKMRLDSNDMAALSNDEPTFITVTEVIWRVFDLLHIYSEDPAVADSAVTPVHDKFMLALLAKRNFNGMLTLVRETERSLRRRRRALELQPDSPRAAQRLAPRLAWLQEHKVVQELLNVNMHQRQYTEGMQKLLTSLAELNALEKDTLVSLWAKQRQVRPCSHLAVVCLLLHCATCSTESATCHQHSLSC